MQGLAWHVCLKKTGVKLELISDIDMLLMIEKGIRGGISQSIFRHAKANDKYMTDYDEKKYHLLRYILIIIIYMEKQCQKNYQLMDLNG